MPYTLSSPTLLQEFFLVKCDKEDPFRIEVRSAAVLDDLARTELLQSYTWMEDTDAQIRYTFELSAKEIWLREVYLTLADCDILETDDELLFRFKNKKVDMSEEEFQLAWGRLPIEYSEEIIEYVHVVNPQWVNKESGNG